MKKQVRIHHLKSDEVEIELFAEFIFRYGEVIYHVKENGLIASINFYSYENASNTFKEIANSWGWITSDCERS